LLDPASTVWETIWDTGALDNQHTMQALHQFLFAGDAINKEVNNLSGGERTRLALCKLMVTRPNLLLLDEPTNHLDIRSREAVEEALRRFPGAVVVISHDRYFLDAVATRMLAIQPTGHRLFDGGYRAYRERYHAPATPPPVKKAAAPPPVRTRAVSPNKRLPKLEAEIAQHEARMKEITALLSDAATWANGGAAELSAEYDTLNTGLEKLYAEWTDLAEAAAAR
jgi:ATP-binding cassette subfamily F protein 3